MPIAFDPPTHAPHGTLPVRGARSVDDDPATLDIFTQLLLAAGNAQEPAAPTESTGRPAKDDPTPADPTPLTVPLPVPLMAAYASASDAVAIVPSGKIREVGTPSAGGAARTLVAAPLRAGSAEAPVLAASAPASRAPVASIADPLGDAMHQPAPTAPATPAAAHDPATTLPQATPDTVPARASAAPATPAAALAALLVPTASAAPDKATSARTNAELALPTVQPASAPAVAPAPPAPHVETIGAPAFTPGWQDETVSKLAHIVLTRNERAELKLNPAELGPVNVRVEMRADTVSVQIVAASAETRSALEQSLPQLRDLLASQGITLGQASVHDGAAQRDARPDAWTPARGTRLDDATPASRGERVELTVRRPDRLVDVFA